MEETVDFLQSWCRRKPEDEDADTSEHRRRGTFEKNLDEFRSMWNGSFSGPPMHRCRPGHCVDKEGAARKMSTTFIALLLSCLPAVPAPSKWTKVFASSDFVGVGILINCFLPCLFELAFQPLMFRSSDTGAEDADADPRLLEGLFFHAVKGRRYASSTTFLSCPESQWNSRCWMIVSEHLRRLVYSWLHNLKKLKDALQRFPLCELLDARSSPVWAVLQNVAHQLLDDLGRKRLCVMWQASGCASYEAWCSSVAREVRAFRRALVALSGWIYRRHVVCWEQFPWSLLRLVDAGADQSDVGAVKAKWDSAQVCCVPAGLSRDLKRKGYTAETLSSDFTRRALIRGVGQWLGFLFAFGRPP